MTHKEHIRLETDRLWLRGWREDDLEPFAKINVDPRVMEFFPSTLSADETRDMMANMERKFQEDGFGMWAAELKETRELIGFCGLSVPKLFKAHFTPCVEIGWRLAFEHWGRGLAPEAAAAAVRFGFEKAGLDEIVSFTSEKNARSRRVMEKIGMSHDPGDDFDHPKIADGHPLRRHVLYRLRAGTKGVSTL